MALKTKGIKELRIPGDGLRVSVMSRHTLSDGITPDPEITLATYDEWWPELAPPAHLIGSYYKRGLEWKLFEEEFVKHLSSSRAQTRLWQLIALSQNSPITILCIEKSPAQCHRRLVAEACKKMDPFLEVIIE